MERILIVDDEEAPLFAMAQYFTQLGLSVDCAREFEEAEALLAHTCYSAVIVDLRLSELHGSEGLEIVRFIRTRCDSTRAILLTAYASPAVEQAARRAGADRLLQKPMPLQELAATLAELWREA
ncbi:MAG TPA: response regulator [Thermoanaerobaculia bacterium]|nr:response regulator [Thermoanaerobaculia bacterium]